MNIQIGTAGCQVTAKGQILIDRVQSAENHEKEKKRNGEEGDRGLGTGGAR